jgi:hypothetical protein
MSNKKIKQKIDIATEQALINVESEFVEKATQFTMWIIKERLGQLKSEDDINIVSNLTKYLVSDFLELMMASGNKLTKDELADIDEKTLGRFFIELEQVTKTENTDEFKMQTAIKLGSLGIDLITDLNKGAKLKQFGKKKI